MQVGKMYKFKTDITVNEDDIAVQRWIDYSPIVVLEYRPVNPIAAEWMRAFTASLRRRPSFSHQDVGLYRFLTRKGTVSYDRLYHWQWELVAENTFTSRNLADKVRT